MSIHTTSITAIFDRLDIEEDHRQDPELLGAAYALAFLEAPDGGAEERFYDSYTTLPGDTPEAPSYEMPTRAMLTEIYEARIYRRVFDLKMADLEFTTDATS
jgi:hypothetical protein